MINIPCVILCGGKSSRMGEDKSLLPFFSKPTLTQYQYDRLKPFFKDIFISSKINKFNFECKIITDIEDEHSPIIALNSIFNQLDEEKIFIITVDTPLVKIESIEKLIKQSIKSDICIAQTIKTHNLCGVFSSNIKTTLAKMIKEDIHKVGFLLKTMNTKIVQFENDDEFINLNEKNEYEKALTIISNTNDNL